MSRIREIRPEPSRINRRRFFGWFSASVIGGVAGGSMIRNLMRPRLRRDEEPIVISRPAHSVPRTKKG